MWRIILATNEFKVDISSIINVIEENDKLSFDEHKERFVKVAFDVYSPKNDVSDDLWVIQDTDDGQFLVRTNWNHDDLVKKSKEDGWDAVSNKKGDNITLYYKDLPLINLSAEEYGFNEGNPRVFVNSLLRFMNDKKNVAKLLSSLPEKKAAELKRRLDK